ncbi:HIT family protein [Levilactobacillus namurensis]|uniref:HIT family protein n=1 Tax=Levilactobacillus namurensis TaxID=380393 RepID=UPI0022322BD4|nr:hypothetical protein [Levilactobacillus namurensis]MCW3777303.1 hypothetical protein [Levilactobacillus namurensis]MDT7018631.1 hypothetical protein [Levilactobacillus namurensis]WNN64390.1 hypothetical protein RIN67_06635 [Levilactobacillus namurensis]
MPKERATPFWQTHRIESALAGTNPMVLTALPGGFVALGDVQFLPGYCVLLPKRQVGSLNELSWSERADFLTSMAYVGDALLAVCHPQRINYDILGNTDEFLHAHIFPRYAWEPPERRKMPVWQYPAENWHDPETAYQPAKHAALRQQLKCYLDQHLA